MAAIQQSLPSRIRTVAMWLAALILWLVIVSVYSDASPYGLGEAAGKFLFFGLISAVILGWSTKTRPFAPLGALLLGAFFLIMGNRADERARVLATSETARVGAGAAMDAMTRGGASSLSPAPEIPPGDSKGKVAWFLRKHSEAYASAQHRMAIEQGADIDLMPREWPHARYIADAAAYPAVESYFLGFLRYVDKAREHYPVLMDSITMATASEAKLSPADSADVMDGMKHMLALRSQTNAEMFDSGAAYGQAALRLHYFLTSLGSRVTYDSDADRARFSVDAERERAAVLLSELQKSAAKVEAASKPHGSEEHSLGTEVGH
jgi:hypothetical protein